MEGKGSVEGLLVVEEAPVHPSLGWGHLLYLLTVALWLVPLLPTGDLLELTPSDHGGEALRLTKTRKDMCFSTATFTAEVWVFMWST